MKPHPGEGISWEWADTARYCTHELGIWDVVRSVFWALLAQCLLSMIFLCHLCVGFQDAALSEPSSPPCHLTSISFLTASLLLQSSKSTLHSSLYKIRCGLICLNYAKELLSKFGSGIICRFRNSRNDEFPIYIKYGAIQIWRRRANTNYNWHGYRIHSYWFWQAGPIHQGLCLWAWRAKLTVSWKGGKCYEICAASGCFFLLQELLIKGFSEKDRRAQGMLRYCIRTKDSTLNRESLSCRSYWNTQPVTACLYGRWGCQSSRNWWHRREEVRG